MDWDIIAIVLSNVLFLALGAMTVWCFYIRQEEKSMRVDGFAQSNYDLLTRALRKINVEITWKKNDKGGYDGIFDYQSGHFRAKVTDDTPFVELMYPFFYETDFSDVELVREVCNLCNKNTEMCQVVYSMDEKNGTVDLHILSHLFLSSEYANGLVERALTEIFVWQNAFVRSYGETKSSGEGRHDKEKTMASISRELCMLHEMEMARQDGNTEWHGDAARPQSLRRLLDVTLNMVDIVPVRLIRFFDDGQARTIEDPDKILDFHFAECLISDNHWTADWAMLRLDYYDPRRPARLRHLVVSLCREDNTADTLYYRATLMRVPLSDDRKVPMETNAADKTSCSVLLGYDLEPGKTTVRFDYLWKEIEAKQKVGSTEALTDDERLLLSLKDAGVGRSVYHGKELFLGHRYYEALEQLEGAYRHIIAMPAREWQATRDIFFEVCYLVGFCYSQLKQYDRASYYLEFTLPLHRVNYTEAYVNNLVASADIRSLNVIDILLSQVEPASDDEDEDDGEEHRQTDSPREDLLPFVRFLHRSKTAVLIAQRRYKEAEALLRQLLDDPDNSDFALKELAHIRKLRGGDG